jgi:hypothetical protein
MTEVVEKPSDVAFGKMIDLALEATDALGNFYAHMEDVRRNMLAGTPLPEMKAIEITGAVHEAHDRFFDAECEYWDAIEVEEEAEKVAAAREIMIAPIRALQ